MASRANILKKFRRWLRQLETKRLEALAKTPMSVQVGKLMKDRGGEIISMTTL